LLCDNYFQKLLVCVLWSCRNGGSFRRVLSGGESRFDPLDNPDARPVSNRAGWRKGVGSVREWLIPPQVWKSEICNGLDAKLVARTLADRGLLVRAKDGLQSVRRIDGKPHRTYFLTAKIFEGVDEGSSRRQNGPRADSDRYSENRRNGRYRRDCYVC